MYVLCYDIPCRHEIVCKSRCACGVAVLHCMLTLAFVVPLCSQVAEDRGR